MTRSLPLAAMLLTGGQSRRMGRDKATIVIGGARLADRTAARLSGVADPVIEVGPGYTLLPCTREQPPGGGPLAALAAGTVLLANLRVPRACTGQLSPESEPTSENRAPAGERAQPQPGRPDRGCLVVATDLPHLTIDLLRLLATHPSEGCVVPLDAAGRPQVACARYSAEALSLAPGLVTAGHRSLKALLDRVAVTWLPAIDWTAAAGRADALTDIDTPDDLAAVRDR